MTDKIIELRKLIPIPIGEALQLLKANDGDVEKSLYLFKAKSIKVIQELTGCDEEMANKYYEAEKYDFNRAVSNIKDAIYDQNYVPISGVTKEGISNVLQWLRLVEAEDFGVSLDYRLLDKTLDTLSLISPLAPMADMVKKARAAKDIIFEGYVDTDPLDEFVRRHRQLDDSADFQQANTTIGLKITVMKDELLRHSRNL